ncbi:hypothetical protein EDC96DRAFT_493193 [Choanephora cucurbitarum]|nr:hypothetical protein EDC96DRAFT_493193 [Choanephora cucurbitarum]
MVMTTWMKDFSLKSFLYEALITYYLYIIGSVYIKHRYHFTSFYYFLLFIFGIFTSISIAVYTKQSSYLAIFATILLSCYATLVVEIALVIGIPSPFVAFLLFVACTITSAQLTHHIKCSSFLTRFGSLLFFFFFFFTVTLIPIYISRSSFDSLIVDSIIVLSQSVLIGLTDIKESGIEAKLNTYLNQIKSFALS